jgi:hypothetical protein
MAVQFFSQGTNDLQTAADVIYGFLNFVVLGFGVVIWALQRKFKIFRSEENLTEEEASQAEEETENKS